jgi:hypothetical protein
MLVQVLREQIYLVKIDYTNIIKVICAWSLVGIGAVLLVLGFGMLLWIMVVLILAVMWGFAWPVILYKSGDSLVINKGDTCGNI